MNAGEAFYRLKEKSPSEQLNKDIVRLREAMQIVFDISEHEVEAPRQQCSINTKATAQYQAFEKMREKHDKAFEKMRVKKKAWQGRYVTAEKKLIEISGISKQRNRLRYPKNVLFPARAQLCGDRDDNKYIKDNTNQSNNVELFLKISSHDQAISSLEQALNEMSKSTQDMKAEIYGKEERQRMIEKEIQGSHIQKDVHLNKLIICVKSQQILHRNET